MALPQDVLNPRNARLRCVGAKRLQPEAWDRPKMADVPGHEYLAGLASGSGDEGIGNLQTTSQRVRFHQRSR